MSNELEIKRELTATERATIYANRETKIFDKYSEHIERIKGFTNYVIKDINDQKGFKIIDDCRKEAKRFKNDVEKDRKTLKEPILLIQKMIDSRAKEVSAPFEEVEKELTERTRWYEEEWERIKREEEAKEQERLMAMRKELLQFDYNATLEMLSTLTESEYSEILTSAKVQFEEAEKIRIENEKAQKELEELRKFKAEQEAREEELRKEREKEEDLQKSMEEIENLAVAETTKILLVGKEQKGESSYVEKVLEKEEKNEEEASKNTSLLEIVERSLFDVLETIKLLKNKGMSEKDKSELITIITTHNWNVDELLSE